MGCAPVKRYTCLAFHIGEERRVAEDPRGPLTVLLVDDSEEFLGAAASWIATQGSLRLAGTARNGQEALAWLDRSAASLVLMDCFMPVMDGFEATRRIKSVDGSPLVIMLSVHQGSAMEQEAWAAGADGFIAKSDFAGRLPELVRSISAAPGAGRAPRPRPRAPDGNAERARQESGFFRFVLDGLSARLRNVGDDRRPSVGPVRSLTEGGRT